MVTNNRGKTLGPVTVLYSLWPLRCRSVVGVGRPERGLDQHGSVKTNRGILVGPKILKVERQIRLMKTVSYDQFTSKVPGWGGHRRDLHRCCDRSAGWLRECEVADHARRSGAWSEGGHARRPRARRPRTGRHRHRDSRHHAGHQRHHREKGCSRRRDHHRGVSRHPRDRLRTALRSVRHLYRQAGPAGAAGALPHGAGTHRCRRRSLARARRVRDRSTDGSPGAARRRKPGHRTVAQLRQPRARAAAARTHLRATPGASDLAVLRSLPGDPGVRSSLHDGGQRVHQALDGTLSAFPSFVLSRPTDSIARFS